MNPRFSAIVFVLFPATLALAQSTSRVSVGSGGAQGDDDSYSCSISADGRFVAFESWATTLVPGDTNGLDDVFVRDLLTGQTTCVSVDPSGAPGNSLSQAPSISADGRYVAFESLATNLVAGDTNGASDVFVRDLQTGQTFLVSVDSSNTQGTAFSNECSISADGKRVAFSSFASNLVSGDTNSQIDVFVHDRTSGQTVRANVTSAGAQSVGSARFPRISGDGTRVAFVSGANDLVASDSNLVQDAFVRDLAAGTTTRVSVNSSGVQVNQAADYFLAISADGRYVAFASVATNLIAGDTNSNSDVFLRDTLSGQTTCLSVTAGGVPSASGYSAHPALSADARYVAFISNATDLVSGDTNGQYDVFLRDRLVNQTTRLSVDSAGVQANNMSGGWISIAAHATRVAFDSDASNLVVGDTNAFSDVFLRDRGPVAASAFCFGDGTQTTACPCANSGAIGRGCQNSANTGGALLAASGSADPDSVVLDASGALPGVLAIVLQGNADLNPGVAFGDGVRCVGGALKRLYTKTASAGGVVSAPVLGDSTIRARSAQLGDVIANGTSRSYQVYYRDTDPSFCPSPAGDAWNVSNGVRVDW